MRKTFGSILVVGAVAGMVGLLGPTKAVVAKDLRFGGGPPNSEWYSITVAIGNIWNKAYPDYEMKYLPGGGVSNVIKTNAGNIDVGLTTSDSIVGGINGQPPFKAKAPKIRGLASLYMTYLAITVRKDSGIKTLADLKGKSISPGLKGFTYENLTRQSLRAVGLDYGDLSKVEFAPPPAGANLFKDGHVDAVSKTANDFSGFLMDLSSRNPIWILPAPDAVIDKLGGEKAGIYKAVVKKGDYNGIDRNVQVVGYRLSLIVNENANEDMVYKLTKALAEHWDSDLHPFSKTFSVVPAKDMALPIGVAFHPGALRYYKEKGWR